ncbi:MAG: hypothetical protein JWM46_350 [Candidatus Kaiserbacteria bacterium]|nr:hypothetical protein [Candidatus Kaiserbacteria bacterium]
MFDPKAEKTVYFVRHGQSEDNVAPRFQSDDSPLTETGVMQADMIASRAAEIEFDALISSPHPRTKDTAEAIARKTGKTPEYSELFIESVKPTGLAGKMYSDPEANALWLQWHKSQGDPSVRVRDGENYSDLLARADKALAYLLSRPEKGILVVTHGFFLRTMLARVILGDTLSPENFRNIQSSVSSENTGISVVQYAGGYQNAAPKWKLWTYNDHAHLG